LSLALQKARERRRDALCQGETPLPRRRHQLSAFALAALTAAFVHLSTVTATRAQDSSTSPFQPSLTDPRNVQRFNAVAPTTRAMAGDTTPPATAKDIVPPSGAGETGFDSTGAIGKKKKAKKKPGDPRPLPPPPPPLPGAPQAAEGHTSAQQVKARAPYADAFKPADAPPRRPAPPPQDAYEPLGIRAGTFLLKPAVEVTRGYDTNPSHVPNGAPSGYTVVAPALKMQSQWARHEVGLDLRGAYSDYDKLSSLNRPTVDAKANSRIDVSRDTAINTEARFILSTEYPGSPNLPVGFAKLPAFTTYGLTTGLTQHFNRLELTAKASVDQARYQQTLLTDGSKSSNHDRDFNQYGGAVRASYEVFPGVKPFVEVGADTRIHDLQFDRDGLQRDSKSLTPRVGTTFDIARRLTGEISVGYLTRRFDAPTLPTLAGIVADSSLIWNATGLTTVTLTASSRGEETVLPGVSGVLRRDVGVQVDHALRRWLIWTARAGYGFDDYVGASNGSPERKDTRASLGTALTYKFNRELSLKGEYRYDQLHSNSSGVNYSANAVLVGLKLQR
jgi:hypothetical protein